MANDWMKSRATRYTAYASVYVIVILAVLAAINFLANRYDKSYDATANKQFSLSDQTIRVVKDLKRNVNFTYFGPKGDFPQARDLLDRYSSLSPKLHVDYIDPERQPSQAKAAGFRTDSPVVVDSGTKKEGAKSLTEEEVTGALIRSLKTGERNVCVLSAANEHSLDDTAGGGYSILKQVLERDNYKVRTENLKPAAPDTSKPMTIGQSAPAAAVEMPKDCSVLIVGGPRLDYSPAIVSAIKSYVEGGGRALIMLDTPLPVRRGETSENAELVKLLSDWGMTLNKDLVLDFSGVGQLFGLDPDVPLIVNYESHQITQPLTRVPTAWPDTRSIDIKSTDKATVSKLVSTTDDSLAITSIGPDGRFDPKKGKKGAATIAAVATFTGPTQGRVVVTGTSIWSQNSLLGSRQLGNRDLLANMVNWLSSDEELISIRPKEPGDRPVSITGSRLNLAYWLSIWIFPFAVVGFGLATWWKRR